MGTRLSLIDGDTPFSSLRWRQHTCIKYKICQESERKWHQDTCKVQSSGELKSCLQLVRLRKNQYGRYWELWSLCFLSQLSDLLLLS